MKLGWNSTQELTTENWVYNARLQPVETRVNPYGDVRNLARLEYFYCAGLVASCSNNNGNVRAQRISYDVVGGETASWTGTQNYGYDALNRVTTFSEGFASETNDYDAYGNRWASNQTGLATDALTPGSSGWFAGTDNRMLGVGYDGAGNQTQVNPFTLAYDAENHVVSVASGSNGNAAYAYDGAGQRVKKTVNGTVVTVFVYDAAGRLAAEYGPGDGKPGTQYPTGDHLGSVRVTTDAAGNVVRRHDYRPFGQDLSGINGRSAKYVDTKNVPRFTGKERDSETGLDFFGARYFSSAQGRFTSPDWSAVPQPVPYADLSDPQTLNLYSYVRNNPLRKADPDGHCGLIGDSDCTISQFVASLPDRLAGGLKFEANAALEMVGVGPKFTASNAEQADAMQSGEDIKPLFQTGLAMVIPGPKGLKGEAGAIEGEAAAGGRFSGRYADGEKAYRTNVPRDPVTNEPTPLPGASGPHSRLQPDAKNPGRTYSATEFDANGKAVKRTDFAGRKGDQLPHQHEYDPATKGFKEKKPLDQQ